LVITVNIHVSLLVNKHEFPAAEAGSLRIISQKTSSNNAGQCAKQYKTVFTNDDFILLGPIYVFYARREIIFFNNRVSIFKMLCSINFLVQYLLAFSAEMNQMI